MDREAGKDILAVEDLCYAANGQTILDNVSFRADKGDKIAFVGQNEVAITALFDILMEQRTPDSGHFKWGVSTSQSYFPKDNSAFFDGCDMSILEWLQQYAPDPTETYLRGFLGKMLFSGEDVLKPVKVLSGGEKVRCMLSRMMMFGANVLLLDQPTNHLDLESITAVNDGLIDFKGNILFSTYDHEMLQTVANRIIEIDENGHIIDKRMSYEDYLEWKQAQTQA